MAEFIIITIYAKLRMQAFITHSYTRKKELIVWYPCFDYENCISRDI